MNVNVFIEVDGARCEDFLLPFVRLSLYDLSIIPSPVLLSHSLLCFTALVLFLRLLHGPLLPKHTQTEPHTPPPSIRHPHPLCCHLLYHGEKVLLIRTGLSLSAIHHHLTYWSSLLITPFLWHTHTCTHAHVYK